MQNLCSYVLMSKNKYSDPNKILSYFCGHNTIVSLLTPNKNAIKLRPHMVAKNIVA